MTRLRRASAIAALCVLASAATAYAECARVIWLRAVPHRWHKNYRRCLDAMGHVRFGDRSGRL